MRGELGLTKFAFCHMFGCPTCAISAEGCPCPKEVHIPPHAWASETHDLRRRLLRAKKFRISPHHMFANPTRAISAEGCPRTNKTRISPRVWVPDTPQRVTFRKPQAGCPCRRREIEELEKSDFATVQIQFITWKLPELLCSNSCVTISVQMTLQESCRSSSRSGSPASQLLCK